MQQGEQRRQRPPFFYVVYGRMSCPYTARAINALETGCVPHIFVSVTDDNHRQQMAGRERRRQSFSSPFLAPGHHAAWLAQGRRVPLVVEYRDSAVIGGSDALLDRLAAAHAQHRQRGQRGQRQAAEQRQRRRQTGQGEGGASATRASPNNTGNSSGGKEKKESDEGDNAAARQFMETTGPGVHYAQTPFFNAALLAHVPAAGELVLTPEVFAANSSMAEKLRQGLERASRQLFWRKLARADAILHAAGERDGSETPSATATLIGQILAKGGGGEEGSAAVAAAMTFALWRGSRGAARRVRESYVGLCVNHADWFAAAWKTFKTIFAPPSPSPSSPSPAVAELFAMAVLFANGTPPRHLVFGALAVLGADIGMLAKLVHAVLISTGLLAGSFRGTVGRSFPGLVHKERLLPPLPPLPPPLPPQGLPPLSGNGNGEGREESEEEEEEERDTEESVARYVFDVLAAHLETTLAIYDGTGPVSARWLRWAPVVYRTIAQFLAIYRGQIAILVCGHTTAEEPAFLGGAQDLAGILGPALFGVAPISR